MIADNGLAEGTVDRLRGTGVKIVPMGRNRGFGAAVNRAVRAAEGDLLVITNDDISPERSFVDELVAPLAGAEMIAGVLLRAEEPDVIETAGVEVDSTLVAHDYLQGCRLSRLLSGVEPPLGPSGRSRIQALAFVEIGGFDEGISAYLEDADLALRLRTAGAEGAIAPRARARHHGSATLRYASVRKATMVGYSHGYLLRKYGVLSRPQTASTALLVELATSAVLARRHRFLEPALARVRGWRRCTARARYPPRSRITVSAFAGLRRRYARSRRITPSPAA